MAEGKQKAAARTKRVTGQKHGEVQGDATNVPKGETAPASAQENARAKQAESTDDRVWITAANTSTFQLRAEKRDANGNIIDPELSIDFGPGGVYETEEGSDIHEAMKRVLEGKWDEANGGRGASPEHMQTIARYAGISITSFGLEQYPYATWDSAEPEQVVPLAVAVGALGDVDAVRRAIRYEKQSPKRTPAREVREGVVTQLEAILASYEAVPQGGQPSIIHATGGNGLANPGAIQVGAAGIGFAVGQAELG